MVAKTVDVFPPESGKSFVTQGEAIQAARKIVRTEKAGQLVVHGVFRQAKFRSDA